MDLNDLAKNPEQVQALITLLSSLLPQNDKVETDEEAPTNNIRTKKVKRDKKKNNNKFLSMPEFKMHKEDVEIDKLLQVHPPTARQRDTPLVDVVCRVCGKKETVSTTLASENRGRYKCNTCSTNAG
jgi:hypothetical protein